MSVKALHKERLRAFAVKRDAEQQAALAAAEFDLADARWRRELGAPGQDQRIAAAESRIAAAKGDA